MNKRQKNKIIKSKNIKEHNKILNTIKQKYELFDINIDKEKCKFRLKQSPKWQMCIWLDYYNKNKHVIFGEHEYLMDKFKPTRTYLCNKTVSDFLKDISEIIKNEKLHFVNSLQYGNLDEGDALVPFKKYKDEENDICYEGYQVRRKYNPDTKMYDKISRDYSTTQEDYVNKHYNEFIGKKQKEEDKEQQTKKNIFHFLKQLKDDNDFINAIGLEDNNKNGWMCSPRYTGSILSNRLLSEEEKDNLMDTIDEARLDEKHCYGKESFDINWLVYKRKYFKKCNYIIR